MILNGAIDRSIKIPKGHTPLRLSPAPGVDVVIRAVTYVITGSSARHLWEATALLGPRRDNSRYAAFTDWHINWSYSCLSTPEGIRAIRPRVTLEATCTLPRWRPPRSAAQSLTKTWTEYLAAVELHERGHLDIAVVAATTIQKALESSLAAPSIAELDSALSKQMSTLLGEFRRLEAAYDRETQHGVTQGARLPE